MQKIGKNNHAKIIMQKIKHAIKGNIHQLAAKKLIMSHGTLMQSYATSVQSLYSHRNRGWMEVNVL